MKLTCLSLHVSIFGGIFKKLLLHNLSQKFPSPSDDNCYWKMIALPAYGDCNLTRSKLI